MRWQTPDGAFIVSTGDDMPSRAVVWNVQTGAVPATCVHKSEVVCLKVHADNVHVISASFGEVKVWHVSTGQLVNTLLLHDEMPTGLHLIIPEDGKNLMAVVGTRDGYLVTIDVAINTIVTRIRQAHGGTTPIGLMEANKLNTLLYTVPPSGTTVYAWTLPTLRPHLTFAAISAPITAISLAGNGKVLWTGCNDGLVRRFDAVNGTPHKGGALLGHSPAAAVLGLAVSDDGRTGVSLTAAGEAVTWRAHENTGRLLIDGNYTKGVTCFAARCVPSGSQMDNHFVFGCKNGLVARYEIVARAGTSGSGGRDKTHGKSKRAWSISHTAHLADALARELSHNGASQNKMAASPPRRNSSAKKAGEDFGFGAGSVESLPEFGRKASGASDLGGDDEGEADDKSDTASLFDVDQSFFFVSEVAQHLLHGDVTQQLAVLPRRVTVLLSSPVPASMAAARFGFCRDVLPRLRAQARRCDVALDLLCHFPPTTLHPSDQRVLAAFMADARATTMSTVAALSVLNKARDKHPGVTFVALVGDEYGERMLPEIVPDMVRRQPVATAYDDNGSCCVIA
jgi:hypothetical protein